MASKAQTAAAKAINAELTEAGFDPASILALIEMIRNLIASCRKQASTADEAREACFCAYHGYGPKARNKRVRASVKRELPKERRTEDEIDAVLLAAINSSQSAFSALYDEAAGG
jgi:hypothetical protein